MTCYTDIAIHGIKQEMEEDIFDQMGSCMWETTREHRWLASKAVLTPAAWCVKHDAHLTDEDFTQGQPRASRQGLPLVVNAALQALLGWGLRRFCPVASAVRQHSFRKSSPLRFSWINNFVWASSNTSEWRRKKGPPLAGARFRGCRQPVTAFFVGVGRGSWELNVPRSSASYVIKTCFFIQCLCGLALFVMLLHAAPKSTNDGWPNRSRETRQRDNQTYLPH